MTINLNDLLSNVSADALADMDDRSANRNKGGKPPMPLSEAEKQAIAGLVAACLLNRTSQRRVNADYKLMCKPDTPQEKRDELRAKYFSAINPQRTASSFDKYFVLEYKRIKAEYEAALAAQAQTDTDHGGDKTPSTKRKTKTA